MVKTQDLREMTAQELEHKLAELRRSLLEVRFRSSANQLKNPLEKRYLRREVARVLTIMKEKVNEKQK